MCSTIFIFLHVTIGSDLFSLGSPLDESLPDRFDAIAKKWLRANLPGVLIFYSIVVFIPIFSSSLIFLVQNASAVPWMYSGIILATTSFLVYSIIKTASVKFLSKISTDKYTGGMWCFLELALAIGTSGPFLCYYYTGIGILRCLFSTMFVSAAITAGALLSLATKNTPQRCVMVLLAFFMVGSLYLVQSNLVVNQEQRLSVYEFTG
jgi:hypothetical protein